jgi:hypothetical protein
MLKVTYLVRIRPLLLQDLFVSRHAVATEAEILVWLEEEFEMPWVVESIDCSLAWECDVEAPAAA